jgi:hypothetical protein
MVSQVRAVRRLTQTHASGRNFDAGPRYPRTPLKSPSGKGHFGSPLRQPHPKSPAGVFQVPDPSTKFLSPQFRELSVSEGLLSAPQNGRRRERKVVVSGLNARKREKYKPKRVFLETLTGYIEAARVKTLDQW